MKGIVKLARNEVDLLMDLKDALNSPQNAKLARELNTMAFFIPASRKEECIDFITEILKSDIGSIPHR